MMESIRDMLFKIKGQANSRELFLALLILLVGFASFGLGRLSAIEEKGAPVTIENESVSSPKGARINANLKANVGEFNLSSSGGEYVASVKGNKYHFPWCPGAQRINEANKIWFSSKEEAEKAGYTPAANCKGL